MASQKLTKKSLEKVVYNYLDTVVRHNGHDDPRFIMDLVGVRLKKSKSCF